MKDVLKRVIKKNYYLYCFFLYCRDSLLSGGVSFYNKGCAKFKRDVRGENNHVYIGENSFIRNAILYIRGNNITIKIGEGVVIGRNCSIRCEGNNISIIIQDGTTMTRDVHLCAQEDNMSITIGKDCMLSNNIIIRTSDSHPIFNKEKVRLNNPAPVIIGNHVWIAPNSTILKGVAIGNNVIVGSKTLVTKNVKDNVLCAGCPAKVLKENVYWTRDELF